MPKIVYRPKPGGSFVATTLKPGTVLEVSAGEVEHLLNTGAFERLKPEKQVADEGPAGEPAAATKNRKETQNG